jgi:hypothetical protein
LSRQSASKEFQILLDKLERDEKGEGGLVKNVRWPSPGSG